MKHLMISKMSVYYSKTWSIWWCQQYQCTTIKHETFDDLNNISVTTVKHETFDDVTNISVTTVKHETFGDVNNGTV